jgi:seryl-tRNA synthetase
MIDIQIVRDNPGLVKKKAEQKGYNVDTDELIKLDNQKKAIQSKVELLRAERNDLAASAKGQKPSEEQISRGKDLKDELSELEDNLSKTENQFNELINSIPNMPLTDIVPVGSSEDENKVISSVGNKPNFDFIPKNHWEIAHKKGWLDKERAVKVAGSRFVYIKGDLARLEFALWQYGLDTITDADIMKKIAEDGALKVSTKPFTFVIPPAVAKTEVFQATGRLNKEEQTYKLEDEDLWLNASAEHTLAPMYMNEILDEKELPIRFVGYTTAFRREAGTYGKDTEGIFRLHQFNKLEMESFCSPNESYDEHLFMVAIEEYLMKSLKLPYQVVEKCTADIGFPNAKGVDINTWLPGQNKYRETHTADYITDFQARSMRSRFRRSDGKIEFLHTNDATVFSERPLVAIIENYQTKDGDVMIPEVLKKYMNGKDKI